MDHPPDARGGAGLEEQPGGVDVNRPVFAVRHTSPPKHGGQVIHEIHSCDRLAHYGFMANVALDDLDAGRPELVGTARAHESPHPVAPFRQRAGQGQPRETSRPGHQHTRQR